MEICDNGNTAVNYTITFLLGPFHMAIPLKKMFVGVSFSENGIVRESDVPR